MEDIIALLLATIILVYLARLMRALWQPPAARVPLMSVPVEESLDQLGNYPSELVVTGRNVQIVPCQNNCLHDTIHSLLLLSILLWYVALYLLVCNNGHVGEDDPVQEPIQCTNRGNGVSVIGGKDYPPPI